MASERIRMPSSGGGLMRYYDEYKSKIELDPKIVIGIIIGLCVLIVILHKMNPLG